MHLKEVGTGGATRGAGRQRVWAYLRAALVGIALGLCLYFVMARWYTRSPAFSFTHEYVAQFEWDSSRGFDVFRLQETLNGKQVGGYVWRYIVAVQTKPRLDSILRQLGRERVNGSAGVTVSRILPLAYPLGGQDLSIEGPDVSPLMRAAGDGDTQSVRKLLAAGADVNARDLSRETPLIHACVHGRASPTVISICLPRGRTLMRVTDGVAPLCFRR